MRRRAALLALGLLLAFPARARVEEEPRTLRFATLAPKGSGWAKVMATFAADVEKKTKGRLRVKIYYGGQAGDETEAEARIGKGQLDGMLSGGPMCAHVAPSMRVLGFPGLFQDRDEATYVVNELRPAIQAEARDAGYEILGLVSLGSVMIFSRTPIASMAELRAAKLWRWDGEVVEIALSAEMGLPVHPTPVAMAAKSYDEKVVDGFYSIPQAALAFQWYSQTGYITDLPTGHLMGCMAIAQRTLDQLDADEQAILREQAASFAARLDALGREQDVSLVHRVFPAQGLKLVQADAKFRAEFFDAARKARDKIGVKLVAKETLTRTLELLADYRAEHHD